MESKLTPQNTLPDDGFAGTLVGRAWVPGKPGKPSGPSPVLVLEKGVYSLAKTYPTMSELLNMRNPVEAANRAADVGLRLGSFEDLLANTGTGRVEPDEPFFLNPIDLQAVKACGVTFVTSMLERVIEEKAQGDAAAADGIRKTINDEIGGDIQSVVPGSADAEKLKSALQGRGMWSQYLEVGIGPYAEVFSKAQPMSAVGTGANVGIHPESGWNNPEPELVLAITRDGKIVGVTLGNDVNLRDFEGRSALLLGKAKDNNASCALGPFIRLFDDTFSLDDARAMDISLEIKGDDGFKLEAASSLSMISRDVEDLAAQTIGSNHQYPDGLVLFTGTMFAPTQDRDNPGQGFTHKVGDVVTIATPKLGCLVNRVDTSDNVTPWTFGTGALMKNLARRGLL